MNNKFWIAGKHTVKSAVENDQRNIDEIVISKENEIFVKNLITKNKKNIKLRITNNSKISKYLKNKTLTHQGVIALIEKIVHENEEQIINKLKKLPNAIILILDNLTDQRNIGSIIRSAAAFDVKAIFVLKKNFHYDSESMYKAASGAMELVPVIPVVNLTNSIKILKNNNFWIIGLDSQSDKDLLNFDWPNHLAIVVGSESDGIRKLVKENCDDILKININPKVNSLNASNAVAACLALGLKQKKSPGK